ncbi:MAG: phasin family protein [Woeseiaceae bacterium]|nr:phasin family protein [Woeseiaceae bacterium]
MTTFVENFEKLSELQKQGLEPVRNFTVFAVDAFEKLARHNYAVAGDVLEYAVKQAKLPVDVAEPKELFERQVATGKAFAELLTVRANEYIELGKQFKDTSAALFEQDVVEPAKKAAEAATQKAA